MKNSRRLAASARTTRKRASSDRARREASDRGSKPIWKDIGLSTNDNLRSCTSGNRPIHCTQRGPHPEGQWYNDRKEATGANGHGSPPPTRSRIGEATEKALNHPKRDTEKSTFRSRMRSKTVSTQRVTPSRRISPEGKEKQTKPSVRSRTTPASTPQG